MEQNKKVGLIVLALLVGLVVGYCVASSISSVNLQASATKSAVVGGARNLVDEASLVEMSDVSLIDDGTGNKVPTKNNLLLSGGYDQLSPFFKDMYQSPGGKKWNLHSVNNPWGWGGIGGGIAGHTMLYYKNNLYLLGGSTGYNQALWKFDGLNWTNIGNVPSVGADNGFGAVVYKGKIYVFGGADHNSTATNEVWTYDGSSWQQKPNAPWPARRYFKTIVYQNQIWVIGGMSTSFNYIDDVWSYDGTTWTQHGTVPWSAVSTGWSSVTQGTSQTISVFDDGFGSKIYITGGSTNWGVANNNVWTFDGNTWVQKPNATWPVRSDAESYVMNGKLFVAGGSDYSISGKYNDVWSTFDGVTWQLEKLHSAWAPRSAFAVAKVPESFIKSSCDTTQPPSLNISSPNGGETYHIGDSVTVTWTGCDPSQTAPYQLANLQLMDSATGGKWQIAGGGTPIQINGTRTFVIPATAPGLGTIGGSNYKMYIHIGNMAATYNGFDESDATFSIVP